MIRLGLIIRIFKSSFVFLYLTGISKMGNCQINCELAHIMSNASPELRFSTLMSFEVMSAHSHNHI